MQKISNDYLKLIDIMKKIIFVAACLLLGTMPAQAQLGNLIQRAAQKAAQKASERITDAAANALIDNASPQKTEAKATEEDAPDTYLSIMQEMPALPTVEQLKKYHTAKLDEKTFQLIGNPVSMFYMQVGGLSARASTLRYANADSAEVTNMAMNYVSSATGLTEEELKQLENMTEEEQQAYMMAYYQSGRQEAAVMENATELAKYMEPLQPTIDQWDAAGNKADAVFEAFDNNARTIYKNYAEKLATAEGSAHTKLLVQYFGEIGEAYLAAVQQAMQIRLTEQLPIAETIDAEIARIQAEHPKLAIVNYYAPLTAISYFADAIKLLEIPEYSD